MIFTPHILQLKVNIPPKKDDYGRPIPGTGGENWQTVCGCRCDDNTTKDFKTENGEVYRPNYHVVCAKGVVLKGGDEVRCMDGENIRGKGTVYTVKVTNYFNYLELWM